MQDRATQPNLLQALCALDADLCDALHREDLDAFFALMQERSRLIERLNAFAHPAAVDPDWQETAERLAARHQLLAQAMAVQQERMRKHLAALQQLKAAHHSYTAAPPARILRQNLHG